MADITITEKAIKELKFIIGEQFPDQTVYVRAGIQGGGCSGFKYVFTLDENYNEAKDVLSEQDGLKIVVDKRSLLYLKGSIVDFHEELDKRGFGFTNPNSSGSCGCGSSFNV